MEYDEFSKGKSSTALTAQTLSTATTTYGEWIDTQFYNSIVAGVNLTITTGEVSEISWQESDDVGHGDAADIPDALDLYYPTQFPIDATATIRTGTVSKQRWVRLKLVTTGTVDIDVFGIADLSHSLTSPGVLESSVLATADINIQDDTADAVVTAPKRTV